MKNIFNTRKENKQKKIDTFKFVNKLANRKELESILSWTFRNYGIEKACILADLLKEIDLNMQQKVVFQLVLKT